MAGRPQRRARLAAGELVPVERDRHGPDCTCTHCEGFQPGNQWAVTHGATGERHIRPLARNQKRRVLRQMGLRASDLNPVGKALLEHYTRLTAKVVLIDRYLDEVGVLDEDGNPRPCMSLYIQCHRAALNALGRLEAHLEIREPSLESQLLELRRGA